MIFGSELPLSLDASNVSKGEKKMARLRSSLDDLRGLSARAAHRRTDQDQDTNKIGSKCGTKRAAHRRTDQDQMNDQVILLD
jgi:hypothetical protein